MLLLSNEKKISEIVIDNYYLFLIRLQRLVKKIK